MRLLKGTFADAASYGDGEGNGYGNGYGDGDGYGYGNGYGNGDGTCHTRRRGRRAT